MHYQELHGDMPIHALQAFGGYLAMGGVAKDAADKLVSEGQAKPAKELLADFLNANPVDKVTDLADFKAGLLSIVASGVEKKVINQEQYNAFSTQIAATSVSASQAADAAKKVLGLGMSTMTKVLIGLGIAGVVAGGYYMYHKKD